MNIIQKHSRKNQSQGDPQDKKANNIEVAGTETQRGWWGGCFLPAIVSFVRPTLLLHGCQKAGTSWREWHCKVPSYFTACFIIEEEWWFRAPTSYRLFTCLCLRCTCKLSPLLSTFFFSFPFINQTLIHCTLQIQTVFFKVVLNMYHLLRYNPVLLNTIFKNPIRSRLSYHFNIYPVF